MISWMPWPVSGLHKCSYQKCSWCALAYNEDDISTYSKIVQLIRTVNVIKLASVTVYLHCFGLENCAYKAAVILNVLQVYLAVFLLS